MYVVGVAGTVALTAGWILGRPVFRKSRLLEVGHSTFAMLALVTLRAFVGAPVLLEMSFFETDFIDYCVGIAHFDNAFLPLRRGKQGCLDAFSSCP